MPHIGLPELPGILAGLAYRPETAKPLTELAQVLLRGESTLTPDERERIAARVSLGNECRFCHGSHAAAARHLRGGKDEPEPSPKLAALFAIADKVRVSGRSVTAADAARAREAGATDREIHDAVLIAAAFCMYNRYVDGLGTVAPDAAAYDEMGRRLAREGYRAEGPESA